MNSLNKEEKDEANRLARELYVHADDVMTRSVDASDLKFAVDCALDRNDLDSLRVYRTCVSNILFDVFITDSHIKSLRKNGYPQVAGFYTDQTDQIAQEIIHALLDANRANSKSCPTDTYERLSAYGMANPHLVPLIQNFIVSRGGASYEEIVSLVEQSRMSPAVSEGAL
jgi:hypothetical protein